MPLLRPCSIQSSIVDLSPCLRLTLPPGILTPPFTIVYALREKEAIALFELMVAQPDTPRVAILTAEGLAQYFKEYWRVGCAVLVIDEVRGVTVRGHADMGEGTWGRVRLDTPHHDGAPKPRLIRGLPTIIDVSRFRPGSFRFLQISTHVRSLPTGVFFGEKPFPSVFRLIGLTATVRLSLRAAPQSGLMSAFYLR